MDLLINPPCAWSRPAACGTIAVSPGCLSLWSLLSYLHPRFASGGLRSRRDGGDTSVSQAAGLPLGNAVFMLKVPFGPVPAFRVVLPANQPR